jgi:mono/diheme cytochrome c family protein
MTKLRSPIRLVVVACGISLTPSLAGLAQDQTTEQKTAANAASGSITEADKAAAKMIFAAQCAWCHGNYGMTADKGPRLAGTQMTEQEVQKRIHDGKSGYMPSFRQFLDDQQIALMAKYIKSLKPED